VGIPASCIDIFPLTDDEDATALTVADVYLNVACPDLGVCETPAGDQLDEVLVILNTGSSGMSDPGFEMDNFSLVLPGGGQATIDSISCDSSVPYAICGLGPEGPNSAFAAEIFFDAPSGSSYSQVNFSYTAYNDSIQTVDTFTP
jgi:hypothetical protein